MSRLDFRYYVVIPGKPCPSQQCPDVTYQILRITLSVITPFFELLLHDDFLVTSWSHQIKGEQYCLGLNFIKIQVPKLASSDVLPTLIHDVRQCLEKDSKSVVLSDMGVGGTYFVMDPHLGPIAVFKPIDEEPGSVNNPKKLVHKPLLPPGGGALREVAAYLLDANRAGVPETHMMEDIRHERFSNGTISKSGSIQRFIPNIGDSLSMSSSRFSTEDVHNIGILDLRLLNMDRNGENLLVRKEGDQFRLIPIDHAYILPPTLDNLWFEWLHWRQAKVPFSSEILRFIESLDPETDARTLRNLGIQEECIQNMKISTTFLKMGASVGLTLFEIASMVCRKKNSEESDLEKVVLLARDSNMGDFEGRFGVLSSKLFYAKKKNQEKKL